MTSYIFKGQLILKAFLLLLSFEPELNALKWMRRPGTILHLIYVQTIKRNDCNVRLILHSLAMLKCLQVIHFQKIYLFYHFIKEFERKFLMIVLLFRITCQIFRAKRDFLKIINLYISKYRVRNQRFRLWYVIDIDSILELIRRMFPLHVLQILHWNIVDRYCCNWSK